MAVVLAAPVYRAFALRVSGSFAAGSGVWAAVERRRSVTFSGTAQGEQVAFASLAHPRLLHLALQIGLRVSEIIGLSCTDVSLGTGTHVRCLGKGRKHPVPLTNPPAPSKAWIAG
ncbi:hypothetical protein KDL01_36285 [Actinospica durhamensis]|uniref:Uncharacterized protein n=1 Tax=Actinospica durhamensis TaxID=1508375 RepID=A0A941ISQ3_9ACTN|nr:hypothetical protein [Actinospica durhamensis]MBR7838784.1 hypothetical protein [Actinospica durhamensis]